MLEILAQASQSAAQAWWISPITMASGLFAGSAITYFLAIRREITLRTRARKEELPWRVLGALQECDILCAKYLDLSLLIKYLSRVPAVLSDPQGMKDDKERSKAYQDALITHLSPLATSYRRIVTSLGELKGLYAGNRAVMNKLDEAFAAIDNFNPRNFKVPWTEMTGRPREELDIWVESQQQRAGHFVTTEIAIPVKAAIDAAIRDAGLGRWARLKQICKKIHALLPGPRDERSKTCSKS